MSAQVSTEVLEGQRSRAGLGAREFGRLHLNLGLGREVGIGELLSLYSVVNKETYKATDTGN